MTRYIDLWTLKPNDDSIRVYTEEPIIVSTFDRKDLHIFRNLTIAKKPGIYILHNENRRYVGQSTRSIWERLSDHDAKKEWWTHAIAFSRTDGTLDKTQLDRLEKWTWNRLSASGFEVDNIKSPPDGYIAPAQNNNARVLLERTIEIVTHDAKIDIFTRKFRKKRPQKQSEVSLEPVTEEVEVDEDIAEVNPVAPGLVSKVLVKSELHGDLRSDNILQAYVSYLKIICKDSNEDLMTRLGDNQLIKETLGINKLKEHQYKVIDDRYSYYDRYTKASVIEDKIQKIAEVADDTIVIEKILHPSLL